LGTFHFLLIGVNHMSVITEKMIKQAEGQKEPFLVVSYDVPSENLTNLNEVDKVFVRTKRLEISNEFYHKGTQLHKSVYIVATEKVREMIDFVEKRYWDTPFKHEASVKIIGTVFKETVIEVLEKAIKDNLDEIWNSVELISSKVDDFNIKKAHSKRKIKNDVVDFEKEDKEKAKMKQQLYSQNRTLNSIEEKIKDMEKINYTKIDELKQKFDKLRIERRNAIRKIDNLGGSP